MLTSENAGHSSSWQRLHTSEPSPRNTGMTTSGTRPHALSGVHTTTLLVPSSILFSMRLTS